MRKDEEEVGSKIKGKGKGHRGKKGVEKGEKGRNECESKI